jgi:hypothetical protein
MTLCFIEKKGKLGNARINIRYINALIISLAKYCKFNEVM